MKQYKELPVSASPEQIMPDDPNVNEVVNNNVYDIVYNNVDEIVSDVLDTIIDTIVDIDAN